MPNESALIVLYFRPRQTVGDLKTYSYDGNKHGRAPMDLAGSDFNPRAN